MIKSQRFRHVPAETAVLELNQKTKRKKVCYEKKILGLLLAASLLGGVTGCAGNQGETTAPQGTEGTQAVTEAAKESGRRRSFKGRCETVYLNILILVSAGKIPADPGCV